MKQKWSFSILWILFGLVLALPGADPGTGRLTGTVKIEGARPEPLPEGRPKPGERGACGEAIGDESITVGPGGGLADVIVYLDDPALPASSGKGRRNRLRNSHCRYEPRVQTATRGGVLIVSNDDAILHNTHGRLEDSRTVFNLALPFQGIEIPRPLREPGLITFQCDAGHTWMKAFLMVLEHDFHTVTDGEGKFALDSIPAGTYLLNLWHERLGRRQEEIELAPGAPHSIELQF